MEGINDGQLSFANLDSGDSARQDRPFVEDRFAKLLSKEVFRPVIIHPEIDDSTPSSDEQLAEESDGNSTPEDL